MRKDKRNMPASKISYPSPRVSQLDASILDDELFSLLKQQLSDAFLLISTKPWSYNLHPDAYALVLKLVVFKLTTFSTGLSYGFKLQNLKLSDQNSSTIIGARTRYLLLCGILGEYMFKKIQSYLFTLENTSAHTRNMLERAKTLLRYKTEIIKLSGDTVQVLEMLNFVSFLVFGRYPSLVYRALGISVMPIVADLLKFNGTKVNFEYQNRQLVWNVMTEFLVFILPLLQLRKLRQVLRGLMPRRNDDKQHYGFSESAITTRFTSLPVSQCAMCMETIEARGINAAGSQITNPCVTNCDHMYCYVCLATRVNAIENGNEQAEGCPRCRLKISSFTQYGTSSADVDHDTILVEYEDVSDSDGEDDDDNVKTPHHLVRMYTHTTSDGNELDEKFALSGDPAAFRDGYQEYDENEDLEEEGEFSDEYGSAEDDFMDKGLL